MSPTTMWVIIGVCALGIILGIIRQIDWYEVFSKKWGNNPMRGRVYIHFGRDVVFEDADYSYVDDAYIFYTYIFRKEKYAVAIKQEQMDEYYYIRGRIMIHLKFGEGVTVLKTELTNKADQEIEAAIGSPEIPERQPDIARIGAVELNASLKSKTAVELVNTIGNRSGMKFMTILIILAVVAGAVIFYKVYQDNQKDKAIQQQPTATTQTSDPNAPIEQLIIEEGK
jgi:hypothetical protein